MLNSISIWLVHLLGWTCLVTLILTVALWALDRFLRLLGFAGWMYATARQVGEDHDWVDQNCPRWWRWVTGLFK